VDGSTVTRARQKGVEPRKFLEDNDSYAFFRETGGLLKTGPTGTNVMDIQVVILE
jgi:glycerate-2-kinase